MSKKILSLALVGLLLNLTLVNFAYADSKEEKEARRVEKVKTGIRSLGTGENARVEIKLKDKTKLKGYISRIDENSFVVVDDKTGNTTEVPYPQAKQVKGNNLSTGAKIAIGVIVGLAVISLIAHIAHSID